ncbi:scarecrow-like protein 8 [Andrographis paniculata]|uniref:scarecrow-like protein 8 n=1 Tax=Andrographis paniculata TaxID=175694 RepID=UPI0021E91AC4|nr:scarecrow-like protein 8 [Andrographis paniculata]
MSSGFSGGVSDLFYTGRRSAVVSNGSYGSNLNQQQQFGYGSPLAGGLPEQDVQIRRSNLIGKRPLVGFQQQQGFAPQNQGLGFYLRNVKARPNYEGMSPVSTLSPIEFSSISPEFSSISSVSNSMNSRFGSQFVAHSRMQAMNVSDRSVHNVFDGIPLPNQTQSKRLENFGVNAPENSTQNPEKNMMNHRLQELEKQLLDDEEDGEGVSAVTNSDWSETIQNLIGLTPKPVSPSPTASSSSSCSSTSASPPVLCAKQALIDAATAIADGKTESAVESLALLQQVANTKGTSEQRLSAYMLSALKSRVYPTQHPPAVTELCGDDHAASTHLLYEASPCFELGFMAANLAILDAATELGFQKIHVLDFDISQGAQYSHLLQALAKKKLDNKPPAALNITAFTEFAAAGEKLRKVGDELAALAASIGVPFKFQVKNLSTTDLCRSGLNVQPDEALAVNFAFKLYKLPDESVTTENPRDDLLRRVKSLSPDAVTVVEQDINTNTAPLIARVRDACDYYGALFDSLDATVAGNRAPIEAALGRKLSNAVACEGAERLERCEVFGKWRVRMTMAGFQPRAVSQRDAESLRSKLNSVTRGGTGFTLKEESGGVCFGWMGRTLTVASAWR